MVKTKVQAIICRDIEMKNEVIKILTMGGINKRNNDSFIDRLIYVNYYGHKEFLSCTANSIRDLHVEMYDNTLRDDIEVQYLCGRQVLKNPAIIIGWKSKTHRITFDDQIIEVSHRTFLNFKKTIKEIE